MLYQIDNLTRVHGGRVILDIPQLIILSGKVYSLIGPNGAGKTTLLQILAFLDQPSTGKITYREALVKYSEQALLPLRRQAVLVDQSPILFTGPVWKNLDFGLRVRDIERKKRRILIENALELVGMQDFFYSEAHKLSGGETKRVAMARALVLQPEVLLCDEPTANVDTENVATILDILARANREFGVSILFSTHSNSEAQQLAQHTLILKNGRLSDLPRDNVFPAVFIEEIEKQSIYLLQNTLRIQVPTARAFPRIGNIQLHLDPAYIALANGPKENSMTGNFPEGQVTAIVAEKDIIRITVDVGVPICLSMSVKEYRRQGPVVGGRTHLAIEDKAITIE